MATDEQGNRIFSVSNLERMFQVGISKSALLSYEERGIIPQADRTLRGKSSYRSWKASILPTIGEKIGFLKCPKQPKVVSVFSLKGGTGKTTFAFQYARALALHNIRTLVIGLDAQESVTQTLNRNAPPSFDGTAPADGLFHVLSKKTSIRSVVLKTDLPTLQYIPETIELSVIDRFLKGRLRKEYVIKEQIVDPLIESGLFDVILFDCNPAWSEIVTGALAATNILVSPLGCDINSLKAANIFVDLLADFQEEMKHLFERFLLVPSLAENNRLSQHIMAKYRVDYEEACTLASIRRAVSVQEANVEGLSLMETGFKTPVFQDFAGVFKEVSAAMFPEDVSKNVSQLPRRQATA